MKVNGALCALTGYSEQQLLGRTVAEITHPDDRAADRDVTARLLAGEASTHTMDKRYLTAAGEVMWATCSVSLVRGGDGAPLHLIAQVQDITERKGHERILAEERRRLADAQVVGRTGSWPGSSTSRAAWIMRSSGRTASISCTDWTRTNSRGTTRRHWAASAPTTGPPSTLP